MSKPEPLLLIIDARFYEDIADELVAGAIAVIESAGARYQHISVPGVLEIPAALSMAMLGGEQDEVEYDGFVVLGCVIRGETSHYDIVANESARAVMDLAVDGCLAIGNGILTVENREQAEKRAWRDQGDKGGVAAKAALAMMAVRDRLGV
ncbi:MAG: 6,7-dimethyl-8-ribityllumazine synthase [Stappiaceae bacterium]